MVSSFITAIKYALENIRLNFFHTLLSVLGIIIGVSALITMLAMIDGLEKYAEDQIRETTSLKMVQVASKKSVIVNGISIRRDHPVIITDEIYQELIREVDRPTKHFRVSNRGKEVKFEDLTIGAAVYFADGGYAGYYTLEHGINITDSDIETGPKIAVINAELARKLDQNESVNPGLVGKSLEMDGDVYQIIGIVSSPSRMPEVLVPIHYLSGTELTEYPPSVTFEAEKIEDVSAIKVSLDQWLDNSPFSADDIMIASNEFRVEQATRGFLLFRLIMGIIVGISVVVGGVGVMNVLLISVTQRTNEIGIRKAVGSRKKDVYIQFLSESMIVSLFGTVCGIIAGVLVTLAVTPVVYRITELSFDPVFSIPTILTITLVSMVIGVLFGTFPAYKASQLDPIEALRRE